MRYLVADEVVNAEKWMQYAITEALQSGCKESKRGVVLVKNNELISSGRNYPPAPMVCESPKCSSICGDYCMHAEEDAIEKALKTQKDLSGSRMYHIKVKDGLPVYSGAPSCARCSTKVLNQGISEFVLKHKDGYGLYGALEFHKLSLESLIRSRSINASIGGTDQE